MNKMFSLKEAFDTIGEAFNSVESDWASYDVFSTFSDDFFEPSELIYIGEL